MKKILCIFLMILLIPLVLSQESLIRSNIKVKFDVVGENEAILTIQGENLDWSKSIIYNKSIDNSTNQTVGFSNGWYQELEIILLRTLGNYTDALYAMAECNELANFSAECIYERDLFKKQRDDFYVNRVNKTLYEELKTNLTNEINNLKASYEDKVKKNQELQSQVKKLTNQNKTGWFVAVAAILVVLFLLYKYTGFLKRGHPYDKETPIDTSM